MKIFINELGDVTKMAAMPIYGKKNYMVNTLKNLLLLNQ